LLPQVAWGFSPALGPIKLISVPPAAGQKSTKPRPPFPRNGGPHSPPLWPQRPFVPKPPRTAGRSTRPILNLIRRQVLFIRAPIQRAPKVPPPTTSPPMISEKKAELNNFFVLAVPKFFFSPRTANPLPRATFLHKRSADGGVRKSFFFSSQGRNNCGQRWMAFWPGH